MKLNKFSILAAILAFTFIACDKDDEVSNPETPEHSGEIVRVDLSYDNFIGSNSLKSTESNDSVTHNYITDGYTVIIKDVYDVLDGTFKDITYDSVDLSDPQITFDAIGWFGIVVSHPSYNESASGYEAFYSATDEYIEATSNGNITIPLNLTQVSVHLANGTVAEEFDSQIEVATINQVPVTSFNSPVYVPADVDYTVDVTFKHEGGSDSVTNSGLAGEAYYHIIKDQTIGVGIIFELPEFTPPTDGGGIGE